MKPRCGCKIVQINGNQYEIPVNEGILISNSNEFFYISGIKSVFVNKFKTNWFYIIKNILTNKFSEIDFAIIDDRKKKSVNIYNVDNKDYAIPVKLKEEADLLIKKFHKYNKKPEKDFKEKFNEFIINYV